MSYSKDKYDRCRNVLAVTIDKVNDLLNELELESAAYSKEDQEAFIKRLHILDEFINVTVYYDAVANDVIRSNNNTQTDRLQNQLKVAQNYVRHLGGDWSIVTWGKTSDF
jgi:hypothetical protein